MKEKKKVAIGILGLTLFGFLVIAVRIKPKREEVREVDGVRKTGTDLLAELMVAHCEQPYFM